MNIPRADIALRPELLALLPHANLDADHLLTLDDLPNLDQVDSELPTENTKWILVDHNALQGRLGQVFSSQVIGAIDHHEDECKVPEKTHDEPRVITKSGSCTSLVLEHFRESWDALSLNVTSSGAAHSQGDSLQDDGAIASLWDAQVAKLGMASIMIDTHNLKDETKTTKHDRDAVDLLEAKISLCGRTGFGFDKDVFFEEISEAKQSLDTLSLKDILRKDYKQWTEQNMTLGIASVVKPVKYLISKSGGHNEPSLRLLVEQIMDFSRERSLTIMSVMTTFTAEDGLFARELFVASSNPQGIAVVDSFARSAQSELDLEEMQSWQDHGVSLNLWQQKNLSASRKQVAPMLRKAMTSA